MGSIISLTPGELEAYGARFALASEELVQINADIDQLISSINSGWYGSASEAYTSILERDGKAAITRMSDLCLNTQEELRKIAATVLEYDQNTATAYKGQPV